MRIHRLGAYSWLLATPLFFIANVIVGLAWQDPPYNWATHNISDLGNVTCGVWDTSRPRDVCSPWYPVMNAAVVSTGVLLALGVLLTWSALGRGVTTRTVQLLTLTAATGYILAGAYPADVNENGHFLAALLIFIPGNITMLVATLPRRSPVLRSIWPVSLTMGITGVAGALLFLAEVDLGFGIGGMERVAIFPLPVWTVAIALQLIRRSRESGFTGSRTSHSGRALSLRLRLARYPAARS